MNELIELGLLNPETKADNQAGLRDNELIELGLVVSKTKAHDHGTKQDGVFPTTSPAY